MAITCCKDCMNRRVVVEATRARSCHNSCAEYLEAAHENEKIRRERYEQSVIPNYIITSTIQRSINSQRRHHSKLWK